MKKILILLLVISVKSFGQYPVTQTIGGDSTLTVPKGAIKGRVILWAYTDTATANTQRISQYPYAQIATDDHNVWIRNIDATKWVLIGTSSGTGTRDTIFVKGRLLRVDTTSNPGHQTLFTVELDGLVSGGIMTSAGCMDVQFTPAFYNLNNGISYVTADTTLTVAAADPTNPRKDLVVVDTFGVVSIITGTPSPIPNLPYYNPASQLIINQIDVPAGATCLSINSIVIYDETGGTEYTPTDAGTITNDPGDLSNPEHLVTDWFVTSYADGAQMILTKPSGQDTVFNNSVFAGWLWLNNPFTNRQAQMQLFLGAVPVSSNISLNPYFNSLDTAEYQPLSVPHYAFGASGMIIFDKIVYTLRGNDLSGASGFFIDYLRLQTGITNTGLTLQLTTNGSNGPSTLIGNVLNIPVYSSFTDSTFQWSVLDSLSTPPVTPADGDIYLVGTSPTGVFAGHSNNIATYNAVSGLYTFDTVTVVGTLLYNATTRFVSKWTGTAWVRIGTSIPSGGGITNRVTKWTSPNTLGNSLLFDNGTNIGLGTVAPGNYFHIYGANKFLEFENTGATASGFFWRQVGNDAYMVQVAGANVLIPTSASGDLAVRTAGKKILFNTDGGTGLPAFGIAATTGNIFMKVQPGVSGTADSALIRDATTGVISMKTLPSGSGGGIDSVRQTIATDSIKQYTAGVGTLAVRAQRVFNVKQNYGNLGGAKGDGVTNDGPAIQAAINACYLAGGGVIYFPNGKYIDSDPLITSATASGVPGIFFGGVACNSQLYIPYNTVPFTAPVTIELRGESTPNPFSTTLQTEPVNNSGVIIYSTITGTFNSGVTGVGSYPSILGAAGGGWAFGSINDAHLIIKNINFRVKAGVTGAGPTMGAANLRFMSSVQIENCNADIDTAGIASVFPTAETVGFYLPVANNSADISIHNCMVTGYKYGFILSEHSAADNLYAQTCEYGYVFANSGHAQATGKLLAQWCKYATSATVGTIPKPAGIAWIRVHLLDVEWYPPGTGHWYTSRYIIADSANMLRGDLTYHTNVVGTGAVDSAFSTQVNGATQLKYRALGSYPDTTTRFTGFATTGKTYNDSLVLAAAIALKENSLGNPSTNGYILSSTTGGVRSWIAPPAGGSSSTIFSRYGVAGSDSLKAFAQNYYRIGIFDTANSRFGVITNSLGTSVNDTSGISSETRTPAALGAQQYSPYNSQTGRVWATTGSASHTVTFGSYVQPVQGTAGTANIIWGYGYDHATPATVMTLSSAGGLTVPSFTSNGAAVFNAAITVTSASQINNSWLISRGGIGAATYDGLMLVNPTVATSPTPVQWSPRLRLSGNGWDGSATKVADYIFEVQPINGASPISAKLAISSQINAAGYVNVMNLYQGGSGQTTLIAGTKAITIGGLTTSSRATITFVSIGGTVTTTWQYAAVCTANTLTITALTTAGATNTSDTSILNYLITF